VCLTADRRMFRVRLQLLGWSDGSKFVYDGPPAHLGGPGETRRGLLLGTIFMGAPQDRDPARLPRYDMSWVPDEHV